MKLIKNIMLISTLLASSTVFGSIINNGDLAASCNLNGWNTLGDVSVSGAPSNCAVDLNVNDDDFEADLFQDVAFESGFNYLLSVDFDTSLLSVDDSFFISLINEDSDFYDMLMPEEINFSSQSNSFVINSDDLLNNYVDQNWSLSFYLYDEIFDNSSTSTVSISSVTLDKIVNEVPAPSSLAIFALGFIGLMSRRKLSRSIVCHSQAKE